ncbi:MAG TPA: protein kinase, partial [Solirubrobacteraceae bacterium]
MVDLSVGSTLAGCRLEAVAGRGGMGVVYRATQLALERPVAVKVIAPQYAEEAAFRERFQSESRLAASIDHPNVIPVYEAGERDGVLFLIMRWVEGTELRALLRTEGPLAPERAVRILRPVASALGAAHRRGLVHRDVKPANVLIASGEGEDDHIYLTDFGIARRIGAEGMTRTGALVGTLDYISPERIEGGRGDAASDIYALGCMAYETLTGRVPFDGPTEVAKMFAHVNDPPPSPRAAVPAVPPQLDAVVLRAMAKDPAERFATAADLAGALAAAVADPERAARAEADTAETELAETEQLTPPAPPAGPPPGKAPPAAAEGPTPASPPPGEGPPPGQGPPAAAAPLAGEPPPATPPPPRARPSRPRWLLPAAALAVVAAVVVVILRASGGGSGKESSSKETSSTRTTPARPVTVPTATGQATVGRTPAFHVSGGPAGATAVGGRVWVALSGRGEVVGLVQGRPPITVHVGGRPSAVTKDPRGRVWISHTGQRQVTVYDPRTRKATPIAVGSDPGSIGATPKGIFVADRGESAVTRIDINTLKASRIALPSAPTGIVSAYLRAWIGVTAGPV